MLEKTISRIQEIEHGLNVDVKLFIKREDEIHPFVSGNKFRKLKYNLIEAKNNGFETLLTFGGAYSNHIAAVAYSGRQYGFKTIGLIRGEELEKGNSNNPTLQFAKNHGMTLQFVTREDYRKKASPQFLEQYRIKFGEFYLLPEGGTNALAVKGCEEILNVGDQQFDYFCCSVGTGGTISGIINASKNKQTVLGFSALKGNFLMDDIRKFAAKTNWRLISDYHFGGYAKINEELVAFINNFKMNYGIPLDPIYTGKMVYGVFDLMAKGFFPRGSKVLMIHTGGLQGIAGINQKLKGKNKPQIKV